MAAVHTEQGDVSPTPSSPQQIERMSPREMHYYLTEGLEGVEHEGYRDIRSVKRAVDSRVNMVRSGKADECGTPYLVFCPVTQKQLANIERVRDARYKILRFLYLNEPQTLIIKILPGPIYDMLVDEFVHALRKKIDEKGQGKKICSMRSTTYKGLACSKEADGALRPKVARPDINDWPSVILECGVAESPRRLAADARWWFRNSGGAVKMVILFLVSIATKTMRIETWEQEKVENPRFTPGNDDNEVDPPMVQETTTLSEGKITNPLKIHFEAIFLRAPSKKRGEEDYTLTEGDLRNYYERVWKEIESSPEPEDCKSSLVRPCLNSI